MAWLETVLNALELQPVCGYVAGGDPFSEPTSLAALALLANGRKVAARPALDWLAELQTADGMLGLNRDEAWPHWPTSLALLAWLAAANDARYGAAIQRAIAGLLSIEGQPVPHSDAIGHDVTIVGWPWVESTHSWMEPTAWAVLALRAAGCGEHARVREGERLLIDRLLPMGGANYGNTYVLRQELRPQVAPTGLTMVALADTSCPDPRLAASLRYLEQALGPAEAAISLAWGLLGLAAFHRTPSSAAEWLRESAERALGARPEPMRLAALALAAPLDASPLITLLRRAEGVR